MQFEEFLNFGVKLIDRDRAPSLDFRVVLRFDLLAAFLHPTGGGWLGVGLISERKLG